MGRLLSHGVFLAALWFGLAWAADAGAQMPPTELPSFHVIVRDHRFMDEFSPQTDELVVVAR